MDRFYVLKYLTPVAGHEKELVLDQDENDIVTGMIRCHKKWKGEYDKICGLFYRGNVYSTAYELWRFLKENIPYRIETSSLQTVKSPSAILDYEKVPGGTDCKHYALFVAGILDALKRRGMQLQWRWRFVSYDYNSPKVHHVFVVVHNRNGRELWVDPVMPGFNWRSKKYYYFIDKKVSSMLSEVSGLEPQTQQGCLPFITQQGGQSNDVAFSVQSCPVTITASASKTQGLSAWFSGLTGIEKILLIGLAAGLLYQMIKK